MSSKSYSSNSSKITNYSSPFQSILNKLHSYSLIFPSNSRWTKQSFKDECDINTIMARYQSTGEMPDVSPLTPQYLDVTTGYDFQQMNDQVVQAKALFAQLPSVLRSRFANDPGAFIDYVQDPDNLPEMRKLGLLSGSANAEPINLPPRTSGAPAGQETPSPPTDQTPPKN